MIATFRNHWREYLMEAWGLGTFMTSAILFTVLTEHPDSPIKQILNDNGFLRRAIIGVAMGLTAVGIMYSPWGKKSGAHLNPAVTLSFLKLGKISKNDAIFYIIFQFIGGYLGVFIFQLLLKNYTAIPQVNYAVTIPGSAGIFTALFLETLLSFILFITVLYASNREKLTFYTPVLAGILLAIFIAFEAPYSGMSINPARTLASAIPANMWNGLWIYFLAPPVGMWIATEVYSRFCHVKSSKLKCHMTCNGENCKTHTDNTINKTQF
jgi:aquaporin Z